MRFSRGRWIEGIGFWVEVDSQFRMVIVDGSDLTGGGTRKRRGFEVKKGRRVDRKGFAK